jgi:hypothetical protein
LVRFENVAEMTGRIKILTLTPAADDLLGMVRSHRRGGAAHEYWREQCRRWLSRNGYTVTEEHAIGSGKTVDLHGTHDGETMIIEIETGKADVPGTIIKLSSLPGNRILFSTEERTASEYAAASDRVPGLHVWSPRNLQRS